MEIKNKIALVIGHNSLKQGAYSEYLKRTEYEFFKEVAYNIQEKSKNIIVFERKCDASYSREMKNLLEEIYDYELKGKISFKFIIELHFNSAELEADGCEAIIREGDKFAKKVARNLLEKIKEKYEVQVRRKEGFIEIDNPFERGTYAVYYSDISYIILESFFGSNEESLKFEDTENFAEFLQEILESFLF